MSMSIVDALRSRYRQFDHARRRDGFLQALFSSIRYIRSNPRRALLLQTGSYQKRARIDMDDRWGLIEQRIDKDAQNVLDIGCNQGELTRRAADSGLFAVGIDQSEIGLGDARKLTDPEQECVFFRYLVDPENISKLPSFDATFLFTVYYHWGRAFGWGEAESMLRTLGDKTGQLFFQTPEDFEHIESEKLEQYSDRDPVEAHTAYLEDILPGSDVSYLGTTDYIGGERKDAMYLIE